MAAARGRRQGEARRRAQALQPSRPSRGGPRPRAPDTQRHQPVARDEAAGAGRIRPGAAQTRVGLGLLANLAGRGRLGPVVSQLRLTDTLPRWWTASPSENDHLPSLPRWNVSIRCRPRDETYRVPCMSSRVRTMAPCWRTSSHRVHATHVLAEPRKPSSGGSEVSWVITSSRCRWALCITWPPLVVWRAHRVPEL